jgi:hypothetical protein
MTNLEGHPERMPEDASASDGIRSGQILEAASVAPG